MATGMSQSQVEAELAKMVSFITAEASEKALEIRLKADEEFNATKVSLINHERETIDRKFELEEKKLDTTKQVAKSKAGNLKRLQLLGYQKEVLDGLFEKARERLAEISNGEGYPELVKKLVLEGAFQVTEKRMTVRARERDWEIVRGCLEEVKETYREAMKDAVGGQLELEEITLDEENPLPEASAGGVVVTGYAGRIQVDNTLEERLRICETDALPVLRAALFGRNENRKFYN